MDPNPCQVMAAMYRCVSAATHSSAVDDPAAVFSHVAFVWEPATESWQFLCAGRTDIEFRSRVNYWVSKGCEPSQIREYAVDVSCTCPTLDGIKVVGSACPLHGLESCEI